MRWLVDFFLLLIVVILVWFGWFRVVWFGVVLVRCGLVGFVVVLVHWLVDSLIVLFFVGLVV